MMRSLPAWALAGACAFAVSLGAQGTGAQGAGSQGAGAQGAATDEYKTPKSDSKGQKITGCLQEGTSPGTFKLTNATSQRASMDNASEPAAATPAPANEEAVGTSGRAKTYELTAKTGVDLSAHVGHKVEVTTEAATEKGTETGTAGTTGSTSGASGASSKLTVSAIKHVSPTCQ